MALASQRDFRSRGLPPRRLAAHAAAHRLAERGPHHDVAHRDERLAVRALRDALCAGAFADHPARALRGSAGGRRLGVGPVPLHHAAPAQGRHVRRHPAAVDLDVHQVRHAVAVGRGRGRRGRDQDAADLYLHADVHVLPGGLRRGAVGHHVPHAAGGDGALLPTLLARRGAGVRAVRARFGLACLYLGALGLSAQAILPLLWMLSTSLKPPREVLATPPTLIPAAPTLENFARLLTQTAFITYFVNSVLVSGLTVLLTMAVGAAGAYSLTRFPFPGRESIARLILCTYMFAPIMIVVPIYILARRLGIVDTHTALVLSYSSFCLPFSLWLLRAFFQSIPIELEEAAQVDGAGRPRALAYIVAPLALPGLIATSIFT